MRFTSVARSLLPKTGARRCFSNAPAVCKPMEDLQLTAEELSYLENRLSQVKSQGDLNALLKEMGASEHIEKVFTFPLSVNPDSWKGYKGPEYTQEYQKAMLSKLMDQAVENPAENNPDEREVTSFAGIVKKYGVFPFVAFMGAILCGKEYYVLDSHSMLAAYFMLNVTGIWLFAGPGMWSSYVQEQKKDMQWWNDYNQMCVEAAQMDIKSSTTLINTPEVLQEAQSEFNETAKKLYSSKNVSMKRKFRDEMISKLAAIKKREVDQAKEAAEKSKSEAFKYVESSFAKSQEDQDTYLYMCLAEIAKGQTVKLSAAEHPVLKHLNEYMSKYANKA